MNHGTPRILRRREFVRRAGILGAGMLAVSVGACAQPAASPTAAPTQPAAQPTPVPAKPTAAAATKPAEKPVEKPAATQAPPKPQTLQKAKISTIAGVAEYAFTFVGQDKGLYRDEGLDVEFVQLQDGGTQLKALLANEIDLILGGSGAIFPAQEQGAPIKLIGGAFPRLNFVLYAKPGITGFKDLEGKNVGTAAPGSFLNIITSALLRDKGVDLSKVNFVNIGSSPAVFQAVEAAKVDAGPSSIDFIPRAEKAKNPIIIADFSKEMPLYLRVAIVAHEKDIKDRPTFVQAMLNGATRSSRYGLDNKDELVKYGVEKMAKEKDAMEFLHEYNYKNRVVGADADVDPKSVEYTQQLNVEAGSQKAVLSFDKTATLEFQKKFVEKYGNTTFAVLTFKRPGVGQLVRV